MEGIQNSPLSHIPQNEQRLSDTAHSSSTDIPNNVKQQVVQLAADAKRTTKRIFHIDNTKEQIGHDKHAIPEEINNNPGFNPSQTLDVETSTFKQLKNKLPKPHSLKEFGHMMRHPKETGMNKTSETLDASEDPHLSREDDNKLIHAHERLKELEASESQEFGIEARIANLHEAIDEMDKDRERKQVAWITSRYVFGARALTSKQYSFSFLSSCRWVDDSDEPQGARWSQWMDQLRNFVHQVWTERPALATNEAAAENNENGEEPDYDQEVLLQEVERIVISSSPIQRWISELRKLRNWQNPRRTAIWLGAWLAVWTCNRFFTLVYLYCAYRVLQNRRSFDKRESLMETHARADADDEMNNTLNEMITKYGSTEWLQPTIDTVGPTVQPILRSIADWLEIFVNFPEVKTSRATISVLSILIGAVLIANFISIALCMRTVELALIFAFFVDKPLAERYPKYRSVIVPLHWVLWDIPTNTETSFRYLRRRAQELERDGIQQHPTSIKGVPPLKLDTSNETQVDLLAASCKWQNTAGNVILTRHDMRFLRSVPGQELWRQRFENIVKMRKGKGRTSLVKQVTYFLECQFKDGSIERLEHLKKNDEAFNIIFAFSGLQWQQI